MQAVRGLFLLGFCLILQAFFLQFLARFCRALRYPIPTRAVIGDKAPCKEEMILWLKIYHVLILHPAEWDYAAASLVYHAYEFLSSQRWVASARVPQAFQSFEQRCAQRSNPCGVLGKFL